MFPAPTAIVPDASWNTWVQRGGSESVFLEPQLLYDVVLDLSRYAYSAYRSAPIDVGVKQAIGDAINRGEKTLKLTVRPLLIGGGLERGPRFLTEDTITLRLERLRQPDQIQSEKEVALLERYRRGDATIVDVATRLQAGQVTVPVRATRFTGCAQIVFSIWDEGGVRPLDHVVHTVSIRDPNQPAPDCEQTPLQGGFRSLSGIMTAGGTVQADAALQIIEFDTQNGPLTVAFYLDAEKNRAARANSALIERGLYTWTLITPLQDFVGEQRQLLAIINTARDRGSYAIAATELKERLFPNGDDPVNTQDGKAFQSLVDLAKGKKGPPVILMRAVTAKNTPVFVPLALLASSDAKLLAQRLDIVYPLSRERYNTPGTCIDRWSLGVPNKIDPSTSVEVTASARMDRYATLPELKGYLTAASTAIAGRSQALLILAHQDSGNLWYTGNGQQQRVIPENYKRNYPPGSLAILSACSAVNPKGDNQRVMQLLNDHGIDVVIGSPFPIEVPYGVALSRAFVDVAIAAYQAKTAPTVLEMFDLATANAAKQLSGQAQLKEKALEFMVVGDHGIRLCKD